MIGLATGYAVVSYQVGVAQDLTLVVSDSGTAGHFEINVVETGNYAVAIRYGSGGGRLNITMDMHVFQPDAYAGYGAALILVGVVLVGVALSRKQSRAESASVLPPER